MAKIWKLKSKVSKDIAGAINIALLSGPHPARLTGHLPPSDYAKASSDLREGEGQMPLFAQLLYNRGLTEGSPVGTRGEYHRTQRRNTMYTSKCKLVLLTSTRTTTV